MKQIIFTVVLLLFLGGCVQTQYSKQTSALIVMKTPTLSYADMGFIYENSDELKVEIYSSGQAQTSLKISQGKVCMSLFACMDKDAFNRKVLSRHYPESLLEDVFRSKPVFGGKGVQETRNGFTQMVVKKDKYHISYTVLTKQVVFRDTINKILIKVKK